MRKSTFAALLLICIPFAASAQVPATIGFNGVLMKDGAGFSHAGLAMTFYLYDAETGGNLLWQENQTAVPVDGGFYHVELGSTNALLAADLRAKVQGDRWLEVYLGDNMGLLEPRILLSSTAFAQMCQALAAPVADGFNLAGDARVAGRVGIGTATPAHPLQVHADTSTVASFESSADAQLLVKAGSQGDDRNVKFVRSELGKLVLGRYTDDMATSESQVVVANNGWVGLGTSPEYALDVQDQDNTRIRAIAESGGVRAQLVAANGFARVGSGSNHPFAIDVNDSEVARFSADGSASVAGTVETAGLMLRGGGNPLRLSEFPSQADGVTCQNVCAQANGFCLGGWNASGVKLAGTAPDYGACAVTTNKPRCLCAWINN